MADEAPNKNDIQLVFKRLRSISTNKVCFDCNAKNPTWSSVTYGVFICIDCSAVHRSLGVHLTFVRSTQLDTNWTWLQMRQMQLGGNANADLFFRQHNCITTDAQQKYNSRAAQLYREKLHSAAIQAMRLHGTKLHLESQTELPAEAKKEVDFFEEHSSDVIDSNEQDINSWTPNGSVSLSTATSVKAALSGAPNVTAALNSESIEPSGERKPTIGVRKGPIKKSGLGSKKTLGGQRVKANFEEIQREAELADQLKMQDSFKSSVPEKSSEEQEAELASMRLAYQDLSLKQQKEEEKLKTVDPKKAQQMERLGMGFGSRSGVSHSALSDMKTIEQESPLKSNSSKSMYDKDNDTYDDFFDSYSTNSSGFSMYKSNKTPTESSFEPIFFGEDLNSSSSFSNKSKKGTSIWADPPSKSGTGWDDSDKSGSSWGDKSSSWGDMDKSSNEVKPKKTEWGEPERRQPKSTDVKRTPGDEAQKKFGSAKAISSDQFFNEYGSDSVMSERKSNLSRFEGSSSISSAEYFGRSESNAGGYGGNLQAPDLEDVKESVRQGVTKVAGKLSSLANGMMSSIQEKYGGY
uniref:Arf-GAP domain-containing protein n=1 Tax=Clastoptera arizonana TaxID=38151 RepID=A0A1B6D9B9_9HEMI